MRENIEWRPLHIESKHYKYWISNYGDIKKSASNYIDAAGRQLSYREKIFWSENQSLTGGNKKDTGSYKSINIEGKKYYVHRLVASVFIENPNGKEEVNHIDGNTFNNYVGCKQLNYNDSNLEWVTRKENMEHASKNGLINRDSSKRKQQCKINRQKVRQERPVVQLDKNGNFVNEFSSVKEAAKRTGCPASNIGEIARRESYRKTAHGFTWVYKDNYKIGENYKVAIDQQKSARKSILQFDLNGQLIKEYSSIAQACRDNGWSRGDYISLCCNHKKATYKGYVWEFK